MDRMNNHKTSLNWKWIHILTSTSWFQNGPNTPPAQFSPVTLLLEVAWFSSEIFTLRLRKDFGGAGRGWRPHPRPPRLEPTTRVRILSPAIFFSLEWLCPTPNRLTGRPAVQNIFHTLHRVFRLLNHSVQVGDDTIQTIVVHILFSYIRKKVVCSSVFQVVSSPPPF